MTPTKRRNIEMVFTSKQVVLDWLARQNELSPNYLTEKAENFIRVQLAKLNLTLDPDVPRNEAICHGIKNLIKIQWKVDTWDNSNNPEGEYWYENNYSELISVRVYPVINSVDR